MSRFSKSTWYSIPGALVVVAASLHVVTAPYERFPGVVIGGEGEVVRCVNEPLHTWEAFYWTPR